jgi:beta-glucanase (GH16 family)
MNFKDGICYAHDGERQNYLPQNLAITNFAEGGRGLQITANDNGKTWGNTRPNNVPYGSKMYDSGAISTGPNRFGQAKPGYQPFDFKYGYYEARMKFPKGQGYWPAAWSFGTDNVAGYELDLVEVLGFDTTSADMSYHYPGGQTDEWYKTPDMNAAFHTYGVDWQPDHIAWYFDGKLARSVFTDTSKISSKNAYLILNLAVGGDWPGPPNGSTPFPGKMDVDWVRVWSK